jgi:hypothetical protein
MGPLEVCPTSGGQFNREAIHFTFFMRIPVVGAAGFIGLHVRQILLACGDRLVGLDNLNGYYDPHLKNDRLARLNGK